jgi:hypothetical protein
MLNSLPISSGGRSFFVGSNRVRTRGIFARISVSRLCKRLSSHGHALWTELGISRIEMWWGRVVDIGRSVHRTSCEVGSTNVRRFLTNPVSVDRGVLRRHFYHRNVKVEEKSCVLDFDSTVTKVVVSVPVPLGTKINHTSRLRDSSVVALIVLLPQPQNLKVVEACTVFMRVEGGHSGVEECVELCNRVMVTGAW